MKDLKRVLVVEDDPDISEIVDLILSESGFDVCCLSLASGFEKHLESFNPDLVLLDIRLPDGDGTELCKIVKNNNSTKDLPVLLMSAHAQPEQVLNESQANAFIHKPFDIDALVEEVNKYAH